MFEIQSKLIAELPEIEWTTAAVDDAIKDNMSPDVVNNGMRYPIVQISNTVLAPADIDLFTLSIGVHSKVPTAKLILNDSAGGFRQTDFVDTASKILIWLGNAMSDQAPIKLQMVPYNVVSHDNAIELSLVLDTPKDKITVHGGLTIRAMLEDIAYKSGYGIKCSYEDLLYEQTVKNYVNETPTKILQSFMTDIGVDNWFIDAQYNVRMFDVQAEVDSYEEQTCDILFFSTAPLEEPVKVIYTNNVESPSQFSFDMYDVKEIAAPPAKQVSEAVEFDKSYVPDLQKAQVLEGTFYAYPPKIAMDTVAITAQFDPYKVAGNNHKLEVYTATGRPRRQAIEAFESAEGQTPNQQLIEDVSGVYFLAHCSYFMERGSLQCLTEYWRPTADETKTYKAQQEAEHPLTTAATTDESDWAFIEEEEAKEVASKIEATNNMQKAMKFFMGKGASKQLAAAITGNLQAEGLSNPATLGDSGKAKGIAQWHSPRPAPYGNWNNVQQQSLETQLGYVWRELLGSFSSAYSKANRASTLSDAVYYIMSEYEIPTERAKNGANHVRRTSFAESAFNCI